MHGNVPEWCWDLQGPDRVLRGGTWFHGAASHGSAGRAAGFPTGRATCGFRLALSFPSGVKSPEADK